MLNRKYVKPKRIASVGYMKIENETINHIISEWSKLTQREYKT